MRNFYTLLIVLFIFAGCAGKDKLITTSDLDSILLKNEEETKEEKDSNKQLYEGDISQERSLNNKTDEIVLPRYSIMHDVDRLIKLAPVNTKKLVLEDKPVIINVDGMPLSDFIIHAIGDTLRVTFFMDETVKGMKAPVTLRMTKEIPSERALEIAIEILRQHGLHIGEKAGSLYILKPSAGPEKPIDVRIGKSLPSTPSTVVQIVTLDHVTAGQMTPLINSLYKTGVEVKAYSNDNALMLKGPAASMKDVLSFISLVDAPYLREKSFMLTKLIYWRSGDFLEQLTKILKGIGFSIAKQPNEPGILFIEIKFLNTILVITPDKKTMDVVLEWKERLDTPEAAGDEEKTFTFAPQYTKASDLVDSIKTLYGVKSQESVIEETGGSSNVNRSSDNSEFVSTAESQTTGGYPTTREPSSRIRTVKSQSSAIPGIHIAADDRRNVVLIVTTPLKYKYLLDLLREMDIPPKQVLVEVTIADVDMTDSFQLGFAWYMQKNWPDVISDWTLDFSNPSSGLSYNIISSGNKLEALINTHASRGDIEIISKPRLMILNNEEAFIQLGDNVPTQSSETQLAGETTTTTTSVNYINTGLILRISPTINAEGLLTLNVAWEDSVASQTNTSGIDSPTVTTSSITTSIVAYDGQTIVLGGIMKKHKTKGEDKVPFLGDIPLIGNVFKSRNRTEIKKELIVLITPRILTTRNETSAITNELQREFYRY